MLVDIDYETVCVNCKEKGYSFGYTLKNISYQKKIVLDLPQRYLNGPCLFFNFQNIPIFIRSLENSHAIGVKADLPVFSMINAKHNENSTLSRFTYCYSLYNHPKLQKIFQGNISHHAQIFEYVDVYRFMNQPYVIFFYSFLNATDLPLTDFNFYQFYDFDIYGPDFYDSDQVKYNQHLGVIFQYDSRFSCEESLIAGIASTPERIPTHFEGNSPSDLLISPERLHLRDILNPKIGDQAVGLQWKISSIKPKEIEIFPITIVMGIGEREFLKNVQEAQRHMQKLIHSVTKAIKVKSRQEIEPELQKMAFSTKEWCKK
ncbi:hypothetical protein [Candidatus Harpocratesius sp.]